MKTIFSIFRNDLESIIRYFFVILIILAISILPALYAWVNIYANTDPYVNTGKIPVAVASRDRGIEAEDGSRIDSAEEVMEELEESTDIGWKVLDDPEKALQGVRSGKYYASLLYEYTASEDQAAGKDRKEAEILGIDFAMRGMAVFSDGSRAEYPMYYRKAQERLAREQRKLSHCKKGSRNYEKQKRRLARCHEKVRNQRRDCLHKLSRKIADRYDAVAVEDIDMKAMSQCLKFGKSVMDDSYGAFRDMLRYKLGEQGEELVKVDRFFPSSKMCSRCGNIKKELRLDERIYHCGCGNCMDRDINAAVNIREEGRRILMTA